METVLQLIMRGIEDDNSINARRVKIELVSRGVLKRRKSVRLFGTVDSESQRQKVKRIAEHHAGDQYDIIDELTVKEPQTTS